MKRDFSTVVAALLLIAGLGPAGTLGGEDPESTAAALRSSTLLPIRNARIPIAGVLSGGQPTQDQIETAAAAGFRTVINLRAASEPGFEWESGLVESLDMRYVSIPIAGTAGLSRENVSRLDHELDRALERGPVLLHCASGNRIGAMLALRAAWLEDAPGEEALAYGRAAGLTGLEQTTRELLGLAGTTPEDAPRE